jgi:tripartite-type tricarboxylate transporter receptor subunit TctC
VKVDFGRREYRIMKRRQALAFVGAGALAPWVAKAQETYPTKPVRIIVPFGPGGSTDIMSRAVGQFLEAATGQPFIIENKPGATGMIGTALAKNSPADGYTWLFGSTSTLAANPSLYKQLTYDPEDFTPVAITGTVGNFMLVNKDGPYKTVQEFIAYGKSRKPGEMFSGYGNATSRVPAALFEQASGMTFEEVAYRDAVASIQDLMAGRVHAVFPDMVVGESYVKSGHVRALAVTSKTRSPRYPDVEAIHETLPGYEIISYGGFAVRKEVADPLKLRINKLLSDALSDPAIRARFADLSLNVPSPPWDIATCTAFVRKERETWTKAIKAAKIEPQ